MDNRDHLLAIESLNKELLLLKSSKEFRLGSLYINYLNLLKKGHLCKLYKSICGNRIARIIQKKYTYPVKEPKQQVNNIDYSSTKIAVYTCISSNYDNIQEPLLTFDNVDYIAFVDNPLKTHAKDSHWIYKPIPNSLTKYSNILKNRYIKFHPKEFLNQYDYSIYVDGNIRIVSDIRPFIQYCNAFSGLAMHIHGKRDCCYDEAQVCLLYHRGNPEKIKQQMQMYHEEKLPQHFGLNEANVIVSDLKNNQSETLLDKWWQEFVRSESLRDQLAWPFVLWKNGLSIEDVGCLGANVYLNSKIEIKKHQQE